MASEHGARRAPGRIPARECTHCTDHDHRVLWACGLREPPGDRAGHLRVDGNEHHAGQAGGLWVGSEHPGPARHPAHLELVVHQHLAAGGGALGQRGQGHRVPPTGRQPLGVQEQLLCINAVLVHVGRVLLLEPQAAGRPRQDVLVGTKHLGVHVLAAPRGVPRRGHVAMEPAGHMEGGRQAVRGQVQAAIHVPQRAQQLALVPVPFLGAAVCRADLHLKHGPPRHHKSHLGPRVRVAGQVREAGHGLRGCGAGAGARPRPLPCVTGLRV